MQRKKLAKTNNKNNCIYLLYTQARRGFWPHIHAYFAWGRGGVWPWSQKNARGTCPVTECEAKPM